MYVNKHIILGISGSIAAYKSILLARLCRNLGISVHPVLTESATRFVTPLSLSVLTGNPSITHLYSASEQGQVGHVELAHQANLIVVAPATANTIAKLALGLANDPLSAICLATSAPIVVCPAMEDGMWNHPQTQIHIQTLQQRGVTIVPPTSGLLASGRTGQGRMAEPEQIMFYIEQALTPQDLTSMQLLVTAGPTREHFDPARFVSNRSTGKMGYAIAQRAALRGASVYLISGPTQLPIPHNIHVTPVETTQQMLEACLKQLPTCNTLIMAAAPVDFKPAHYSNEKLKKQTTHSDLTISFQNTPDILKTLQAHTDKRVVVGFAAESHDIQKHAQQKLRNKHLDMIVANNIAETDIGFGSDNNAIELFTANGEAFCYSKAPKLELADVILTHTLALHSKK